MKRTVLFPFLIICQLVFSQSPAGSDFPAAGLVELSKYQSYANPKIIGQIGENTYILIRKLAKSGEIKSKLISTNGRTLTKEIDLEFEQSGVQYITNGKVFNNKLMLYGYRYGDKQEDAEIFYKIYNADLNPIGEEQVVTKVLLDSDRRKIGVLKNQMTNLGAITVAPAIFVSDVYHLDDGTYEVWFSALSSRSSAETKDTPFLVKMELEDSGELKSKKMVSMSQSGDDDLNIDHDEINDVRYHKKDSGMIVYVEKCYYFRHSGQNVYDDYRFPYISNFTTTLLKFDDDRLVAHLNLKDYNYQTSSLVDSDDGLNLIGFYGIFGETLWTGVYTINLDDDLKIINKEFLPVEGNFQNEELQGEKAYTMPALAKVSQGIMRNPHVKVFGDGSMALIGELTSQIIQERYPASKDFIKLGDDKYGKRVGSSFSPTWVHSVKHYFNKLVIIGLDQEGEYTGTAKIIKKKQYGLGVRPDKIGYSCTGNGASLTIRFNDTPKAFKKGYFDKKGGYKSEVKKDQILQEYKFESDLNYDHIFYDNQEEKTLIPKATFNGNESGMELYTDGKRYYLFTNP